MERNVTPPISGPPLVRLVGGVAAIAAGYYTDIVEIIAPSEAAPGDLVTVEARVKNTWTDPLYIAVTGHYNGVDFAFSPEYAEVAAGATYSFFSQFYMPNYAVWVEVWSWYYWDEWYWDDYGYVDIALAVAPPPEEYYTLDVFVDPAEAGYVTRDPVDITYISGTRVTLTAKTYSGYQFVRWSGDATGTSPTVSIIMDSDKVVVATFELVSVELAGEIPFIWMWYEPLPQWGIVWAVPEIPIELMSKEIPLGGEIYICPAVANRSEVAIVLHVDIEITYPNGTKKGLSAASLWEGVPSGQDEERAPGEKALVGFEPFTASQTGTYTVVATLSSAGQVLDTVTFELVAAAVAEYEGTLTRKDLEYDETWGAIPVPSVSQGSRGILHVWGRNDTAITQRMGIYWFVADPDGLVVQEYSNWELWPYTSPGGEHGFLAGRFDLDKVGKYTTWIELLMNPDDPQVVDRYIGDLCTVAAVVPEPEFAGFSITEYTKR